MAEKKYIFVNGVMKLNPNYKSPSTSTTGPVNVVEQQRKTDALAIVSSVADIEEAKVSYDAKYKEEENPEENKINFNYNAHTEAALNFVQGPEYQSAFGDCRQDLYQGLINYFVIYEVPIGLLNKLLELRNYRLNFLIDDSGSMMSMTDTLKSESSPHMPCYKKPGNMTRLEEEENRLHIFIDILSFIPTKGLNFFFMTSHFLDFHLEQLGKSPETFQAEAHGKIRDAFSKLQMGGTPTLRILTKSFNDANQHLNVPTAHFLLTDGVPSDASTNQLSQFVKNRRNPQQNPLTLISCTNVDSECEWMKEVEDVAAFCSECDDFRDEQAEVLKDQGKAFPYTRGFWLLCSLIAPMNPDDLDALDENVPLTKFTLDSVLGREHGASEYKYYFDNNPHSYRYKDRFERFLTEPCVASQIVPKNERVASRAIHTGGSGAGGDCCIIM